VKECGKTPRWVGPARSSMLARTDRRSALGAGAALQLGPAARRRGRTMGFGSTEEHAGYFSSTLMPSASTVMSPIS
jgi:hypothetical protein